MTQSYSIIFTREHPLLAKLRPKLERIEKAYSGGEEYIREALIKHEAESQPEFMERQKRAYYVNHPRHIAQLISRYLFSTEPDRQGADERIIADWSRSGLRADEVMTQLNTVAECFGWGWLIVDYPAIDRDINHVEKDAEDIRPYVRALKPFEVTDWSFGGDGKLDWAIVAECHEDKSNPFDNPRKSYRRRLWTRQDWMLFEKASDAHDIQLLGEAAHGLGRVPLVMISESDGFGMNSNHWFEDVVRISDAILNNESEAQMNIVKQMYGLLVVSESFARGAREPVKSDQCGNHSEAFGAVIARTSAIWETNEEKNVSRYISPNGAVTAEIRAEIKELKQQLYDTVGLALQSSSKQAQTAESKAWDNHRIQQFLIARAMMLEQVEQEAWDIMKLWDKSVNVPKVSYEREFSVIELSSAVAALMELSTFDAGENYRRACMLTALQYLNRMSHIAPEDYQKAIDEIKAMPPPKELTLPGMSAIYPTEGNKQNED